jgi:hypothetical protein
VFFVDAFVVVAVVVRKLKPHIPFSLEQHAINLLLKNCFWGSEIELWQNEFFEVLCLKLDKLCIKGSNVALVYLYSLFFCELLSLLFSLSHTHTHTNSAILLSRIRFYSKKENKI